MKILLKIGLIFLVLCSFFNNLNLEVVPFYSISIQSVKTFIQGVAFDLNIGNENKIKNGFNFIWSFGLVVTAAKKVPPLFLPSLTIGTNINL